MSIDRNYISEMDRFLQALDQDPTSHSDARKKEEDKYKIINELRDNPKEKSHSMSLWKDF